MNACLAGWLWAIRTSGSPFHTRVTAKSTSRLKWPVTLCRLASMGRTGYTHLSHKRSVLPTMKKLLASLVLISMSTAYASTYRGVVLQISIAASSGGGTRVTVLTSGATDCHAAGTIGHWYSFEYPPKGGPGTAWLAALLSAKVTQESIVIHGTGTCDASGMEEVTAIDLPSASVPISATPPRPHFPPAVVSSPSRPAARIILGQQWPAARLLEAFDRAAHLDALSNGTEPELRVWDAPSFSNTVGYVISLDRAFACSADYRNDGRTASVARADCEASDMPVTERRRALDLLPALSDFNGKTWGCALGGQTFLVEGFANGRRFAFIVSNPEQCRQSDSLPVRRLLEALRF